MNEKNINSSAGHRSRVKARYKAEGLDNFKDFHALELLLFYAIPQKDTKPLAKELISRFGSFPLVLEAPMEELMKVEGIGENAALFLKLVADAGRYYQVKKEADVRILADAESYGRYLVPRFQNLRHETVMLLCLDAKCKLLCCREIAQGSVNSANISTRSIAEIALSVNASTVVLAHNHPSGLAIPSREDIVTTQRLASALAAVDIYLADHIIVADDDYVSIAQSCSIHKGG
ncbi:MAG: DNA repair protein RadC [Oscillospiraceae bacterium]|nr:DNA repair protein RadC [Oscillospiraceae bacterium]